ncbi:MAG: hypothetical protein JWM99_3200 [Verrucomicrobiales bacterium]|nr:hypothetical protein [Verrucomicrobiales bacterium]
MSKLVQQDRSIAEAGPSPEVVCCADSDVVPSRRADSSVIPDRRPLFCNWWYRAFHRFITTVYFERITLSHPERIPTSGPVLFLGLHRNGAVDGFVYNRVLRAPAFLVSAQLKSSFFGRIFFNGIGIVRSKDKGNRTENSAALAQCSALLAVGRSLFIFPEGTSSLGPRHLPFQAGAAHLILKHLENHNSNLVVLPVGIHYLNPTAFRGEVEVVIGEPIDCSFPSEFSRLRKLQTLKRRIEQRLENVGINLESDGDQQSREAIARLAEKAQPGTFFNALKRLEAGVPEDLAESWKSIESAGGGAGHLMNVHPNAARLARLSTLILSPIPLAAAILNLPPILLAFWAGRKFPDDRNVISLWKILVGIPSFVIWVGILFLTGLFRGNLPAFLMYLGITALGIQHYAGTRSFFAGLHLQIKNRLFWTELREFQRSVSRRFQ